MKLSIRKGDKVAVIAGKERGKRGKVLRVLSKKNQVVVEGLHLIKRATRPSRKNPQGGFITREGGVHASNVQMVCSSCDRPVRIGHRITKSGQKLRVCRHCGADIDKES